MLQMDMTPVKEAISVCSWVNKKTSDGIYDSWFTYNAPSRIHEILIAGNGTRNRAFFDILVINRTIK